MQPKHLYTIRWTQPYATDHLRPYLRALQQQFEQVIEHAVEASDCAEARAVIDRIKSL